MNRKYSVFLGNVGTCLDRYCPEYAKPFTTAELFERATQIDLVTGVDLVATPGLLTDREIVKDCVKKYNLKVVSIAADTFTQACWKQGSLSCSDPQVRAAALGHAEEVIAFCRELDCDMLTFWLGQDGYDYIFQADYLAERQYLIDSLRTLCKKYPDMTVALEYKLKEPRTHSYVSTVTMAILLCEATSCANCKVIIDYGHALLGYENPAESVAILKQFGDRLCHIHINDNYRLWDDDMIVGSVHTLEYLEFFYWLRRTGYKGWMTIDQFPYREDGKDAVEESAKWLDFLETLVDRADIDKIAAILKRKDSVAASRLMRKLLGGN
jgi:xylose isomerase